MVAVGKPINVATPVNISGSGIAVDTVADLVSLTPNDSDNISTLGYLAANDTGAATYIYRATGRSSLAVDAGAIIAGAGADDYFEAVFGAEVSTAQFGIFASIVDNQIQFQRLINYCQTARKTLVVHEETIDHSQPLVITDHLTMLAYGKMKVIRQTNNANVNVSIEPTFSNKEISFLNLGFTRGTIGIHHTDPTKYLSRFSRWDNILCSACSQYGVLMEGQQIGLSHRKWNMEGNTNGLRIVGNAAFNGSSVDGFRATGSSGIALDIEQNAAPGASEQNAITLINPIIEINSGKGIRIYSSGVSLQSPWFENNALDVEIGTNFNGVTVTRAYVDIYNPNWSVAQQATRINCLSDGFTLNVYGGSGAVGGNNIIDGNNQSAASTINLYQSRLSIINWPAANAITLDANGDASLPENVNLLGSLIASGINSSFARKVEIIPRSLAGTSTTSLGINVNAGSGGGGAVAIVTSHFNAGNSTRAALYLLRFGFDGNNVQAFYLGGTSDIATFGEANGILTVSISNQAQGNCSIISTGGF